MRRYHRHTLFASLFLLVVDSVQSEIDNCHMLATDIRVRKDKVYDYQGQRIHLTCTGLIPVNKCEGLCTSRVSPSVLRFPGFKKDCKCCRESRVEDQEVTLTDCTDGTSMIPGQFTRMFIRQPTACHCFECAI